MTPITYLAIAAGIWLTIVVGTCICSDKLDDMMGWSILGALAAGLWPIWVCLAGPALIVVLAYHLNLAIRKRLKP